MLLILSGHSFRYECENLCRLFFPYSPVQVSDSPPEDLPAGPYALTEVRLTAEGWFCSVTAGDGERSLTGQAYSPAPDEYTLTNLLYSLLSRLTGFTPPWGMLTGVHPVKLLRQHVGRLGFEEGGEDFRQKWHVSSGKTDLAKQVLSAQRQAVEALSPRDFSLYVGIPFCPTRCAYCSFISQDIANAGKLVAPYLELLLGEIARTAQIAQGLGIRLCSVYIGGGTPTTLSAEQLARLCGQITGLFDMSACTEFTVEAGRPDTITWEKLGALKAAGVTRVSVNPQTMIAQVLRNIGRDHSPEAVEEAFALAHKAGFRDINADLIVGLPGDSLGGFIYSLDKVLTLSPTNVTVHCLALKKGASITHEEDSLGLHKKTAETAAMVEHSIQRLGGLGFVPYYLYRQTRMAGNLENTGWALPGSACRYNIYTMDESGTVIACGAGGVTKLKDPCSDDLTRVFNFKYPHEYISRQAEILERKDGMEVTLRGLLDRL